MIGSTNSKIAIGGETSGEIVYAVNKTGEVLSADDKVLLRYGLPDITKKEAFNISATSSTTGGQTYVQPVWFNNNLFCVFAGFNNASGYIGSFAYAYNGLSWNKTALTGQHNVYSADKGVSFRWITGGMLVNTFGEYGNFAIIDSSGQTLNLFTGNNYYSWNRVGLLNGVYWDSKYSYGSGQDSGIYAEGTRLTTTAYTKGHYLDVVNKLVLYSESTTVKISAIGSDDASITATYSSGDIGTRAFVGCTGLGEGDYVFFVSDYTKEEWNNMSQYNSAQTNTYGTVASSYSVYKINSSHILEQIDSSDTLYPYINIDKSLWRFDNRNNCLVIGTTNNVYVLEFDSSSHSWELIASDMALPLNNSGAYIYNAALSPDKRRLVVYAGDTKSYAQGLFIYDLGADYTWTVVKNNAQNYDSRLSLTGIATGDTQTENGVTYELIKAVLAIEENVSCSLACDYEPALSIV